MEVVNLLVILISIFITLMWAYQKRVEINTMKLLFIDDIDEEATDDEVVERQKKLTDDKE